MPGARPLLEIAYQTEAGSSESMAPSREGLGNGGNPTAPAFGLGRQCSPTPSLRLAFVAVSLGISAICFEKLLVVETLLHRFDVRQDLGVHIGSHELLGPF